MAKVRFVGSEPRDVPLLGRTVEPDELIEIPDDVFDGCEWPTAQWDVVGSPAKRGGKSRSSDDGEGN